MRIFAPAFFVVYLLALTYPFVVPANRVTPFVLGLPFSLAWSILWVVLGWLVLIGVHLTRPREEE